MATAQQWIEGARPRTLPAALAPVISGTAIAAWADAFVWWKALLALVVALSLQIGVNYANDYSDGIRGTDDDRVGPLRLTGSGLATARSVKLAAFGWFGVAGVAGLALAVTTSWWLVAVGAVCIVAAWFYTGGDHPYGYAGLGEVMVFIFFGLVATIGTTWVQVHGSDSADLDWEHWPILIASWAGIGVGALTCAILVANNLRDIPTDTIAGKKTLAVRLGDRHTRGLYLSLLVVAGVATLVIAVVSLNPFVLLGFGFVWVARPAIDAIKSGATGPALIPVLGATGKATLAWSVLISVPLVVVAVA